MAYSTIPKGSLYMNTKLYTGNATDNTTISGVGFQSDWTWIKERSSDSAHTLQDSVRGATKQIFSNATDAEANAVNKLKSWNSDGFIIGTSNGVNQNGETYAAWNWKANGQGSSNTAGSINTTYTSVNTTAGFSISQYTGTGSGATVGHGLGVKPKIIFFKNLSISANWVVQSTLLANRTQLVLNSTDAQNTDSRLGNLDSWSNSVFSLGTYGDMNGSGNSHIAYCFAEKQGYSKFGTYAGNGNADGPFIYTGFKPAFILAKRTDAAAGWVLFDNKRIGYNGANYWLDPQNTEVDQTDATGMFDQLSNGFKIRSSFGSRNGSGGTYIYMAFASNPYVATSGSDAIPVTAE